MLNNIAKWFERVRNISRAKETHPQATGGGEVIRREKKFCTDLVKQCNKTINTFAFKIPDMPFNPSARFNPTKAVDIIICSNRRFICVEAKMWKNKKDPSPGQLKDLCRQSQLGFFEKVFMANGITWIAAKKFLPRKSVYYLISSHLPYVEVAKFPTIKMLADWILA